MKNILVFALFMFGLAFSAKAEHICPADSTIVEVSGVVLTAAGADMVPVPYVTVGVTTNGRGTYANYSGVFSIVCRKGESLVFTAYGFKKQIYDIPIDLKGQRHSVVVVLYQEDETKSSDDIVFPWPKRENLRAEFLAMKPDQAQDMQSLAQSNLRQSKLSMMAKGMLPDGNEGADYYMRQQASNLYFYNQAPPQNIFNPLAWSKFLNMLQENQAKKKKPKDDDE